MNRHIVRYLRTLITGALLAAVLWPDHGNAQPLALDPATEYFSPADQIEVFIDPSASLNFQQVQAQSFRQGNPETFGFERGNVWLRLTLQNPMPTVQRWVVVVEYTLLDAVDFYWVSDSDIEHTRGGDRVPFHSRPLDIRHFNQTIDLTPGMIGTLYLRVRSESSVQVPIRIMTPEALAEHAYLQQFALGILYGVFVAMFLYNLILYASIRDPTILYYVLYLAFFALTQFSLNGLAFQYFWPDSPDWANTAILVSIPAALLGMSQFTRTFLALNVLSHWLDVGFRVVMGWLVFLLVASFAFPYGPIIRLETATVFVIVPMVFVAIVMGLRNGYRPAVFFATAWCILLVGIMAYASVSFGLLPKIFITEYGLQIGTALEMILLSFALAYRIKVLQEASRRTSAHARQQLEYEVRQRTSQLRETLAELEKAHDKQKEASELDGLTRVKNRRFLDRVLGQSLEQAAREETGVGLIIFDLDHFKRVNDRFGHLAGDDCLRRIAQIATRHATAVNGGHVARYGGEEFVVFVPRADLAAMLTLAEDMRLAMEADAAHNEAGCTASFGVVCVVPGEQCGVDTLIGWADRALYRAKRAGRNRVEAYLEELHGLARHTQ